MNKKQIEEYKYTLLFFIFFLSSSNVIYVGMFLSDFGAANTGHKVQFNQVFLLTVLPKGFETRYTTLYRCQARTMY